jgi:2-methylisocitrate lyase-like PEP mutase family enzyme
MDRDTVGALVREIDGPLNILAAAGGVESRLTAPELEALGVRRATIGGSLALGALAFVRRAADELRATGRFSYAADALRGGDANAIMGRHADRTGR